MGHWEESVIQVILSMWLTVENHRLKLRMSEPKLQVILIPNRCERLKFQRASFFASSSQRYNRAFSSACGSCTRNSRCVCVSVFARSRRKSGDQRCSFAKTAPSKLSRCVREFQPMWNCIWVAFERTETLRLCLALLLWDSVKEEPNQNNCLLPDVR